VRARVRVLDAERGCLSVTLDGKEREFALPKDIKVMNGTRVMRLRDLQANMDVGLVLSMDQKDLLVIDIRQDAQGF
jgi:hypothetical protein